MTDRDDELASDLDATVGRMAGVISLDRETKMQTPMGPMTEAELVGLIRPSLNQWAAANPDTCVRALAVIHRMTGDLLAKHADADPNDLAVEAIERYERENSN